ncbi:MAG: tRNA (adenosine(37)-N6)-dimethylallyltransferase MiaA [Lachnospiraceae bacterium]|nr:tRNA (adenosine(37)-N6)-dimethylallyltransferase MiaA [Lachnospiraceae bacterium]
MALPLVIIAGPTAVGKSDFAIELAKRINGEIISADSMQVYKGMDIGSAKVTPEEMQGIRHYLIDILDPKDEFSVAVFKEYAKKAIEEIVSHGKIPIIAGGTGFYIQALLYDIDFTESLGENPEYRSFLCHEYEEKGADYLFEQLKKVDPDTAEIIHKNDEKRVVRALEFYHETGKPISVHNKEQYEKTSNYNFAYFVLNDYREKIYSKIDERVDIMVEKGLVKEVEMLKDKGMTIKDVSMQGLGYKEILMYLSGDISLKEAIYRIKRDSRHFAKRQLTWFKRERDVIWLNRYDYDYDLSKLLDASIGVLKDKSIV